jgi:surface antigen
MIYSPRLTAPISPDENYFTNKNVYVSAGYPLPNCTTYVHGRWLELGVDPIYLSTGSGKDYWPHIDLYNRSNIPSVGAVMCFGIGSHEYGHVAIVEIVHDDNTVTLSQSDFFGDLFSTVRIGKNSNIYGLPFQGFIKNPLNFNNTDKPKSKYKFMNLNKIRRITIGG